MNQPNQKKINVEMISTWLTNNIAEQLEVEADEIDQREPIANYSLDSARGMVIISRAEKEFGFEISPMLLWYYPTIEALAQRLAEDFAESDLEVFEI